MPNRLKQNSNVKEIPFALVEIDLEFIRRKKLLSLLTHTNGLNKLLEFVIV